MKYLVILSVLSFLTITWTNAAEVESSNETTVTNELNSEMTTTSSSNDAYLQVNPVMTSSGSTDTTIISEETNTTTDENTSTWETADTMSNSGSAVDPTPIESTILPEATTNTSTVINVSITPEERFTLKYKDKYSTILGNKLTRVSTEKLRTAAEKINTLQESSTVSNSLELRIALQVLEDFISVELETRISTEIDQELDPLFGELL